MAYRFYFKVNGQKLTLSQKLAASDSIKYLDACFEFTSDWDGLHKYATFKQSDYVYQVEILDNVIDKNSGINLSIGEWTVSVHGEDYDGDQVVERITTVPVRLIVEKSGIIDGEPFPTVEPSLGEQIIARATQQADRAELNANNAEGSAALANESANAALLAETNAYKSEIASKTNADNAKSYSDVSLDAANQSKDYRNDAEKFADRAEQAMDKAGWAEFYIDSDGYLNVVRSDDLTIDFAINNGYLEVVY